jgi:hypothetical protein
MSDLKRGTTESINEAGAMVIQRLLQEIEFIRSKRAVCTQIRETLGEVEFTFSDDFIVAWRPDR